MRILNIITKRTNWSYLGKALSYCVQFGLDEGLQSYGEVDTVFTSMGLGTCPEQWMELIKKHYNNRYDQIWVELIHTRANQDFLKFLEPLAPVRVATLIECIATPQCHQIEYKELDERLKRFTHIIPCDETDAQYCENLGVKSRWIPTHLSVPKRWVAKEIRVPENDSIAFFGKLYDDRAQLIQRYGIKLAEPPENNSNLPRKYSAITAQMVAEMNNGDVFEKFVPRLRAVREELFKTYLDGMRKYRGVISLTGTGLTYASRVAEAIGAGVPIIARNIPNRPMNNALFKNIVIPYDANDEIENLVNIDLNPYAQKGLDSMSVHTTEYTLGEAMRWINGN